MPLFISLEKAEYDNEYFDTSSSFKSQSQVILSAIATQLVALSAQDIDKMNNVICDEDVFRQVHL